MRRHDHMSLQDEGQIVEKDQASKLPLRRRKEARPAELVRAAKAAMTHIVVVGIACGDFRPVNAEMAAERYFAQIWRCDVCAELTLTRPLADISF